ncbi:hypothetical protein LPJ61_006169 [Coemansia biformis]|uniref:Uncharacterized protein n=1 Tax=Coemansia biformis TaxID=1286918 RepID=A0A9W7XTB4_9FUNG|nr:hypothetical protein LPJ61_006169 [Coemansia biformis]
MISILDLAASTGNAHVVRSIEIVLHYQSSMLPGLRKIVEAMRAVTAVWSWIRVLRFEFLQKTVSINWSTDNNTDYAQDAAVASAALAGLFPRIDDLTFLDVDKHPAARLLYENLASCYTGQLQDLYTTLSFALPSGRSFSVMKTMVVESKYTHGHQIPLMDINEIECLRLIKWPVNQTWAELCPNHEVSPVIVFPKLRVAHFQYSHLHMENGVVVHQPDGHPWTLSFPKLRMALIYCPSDICPVLDYAVFPAEMDKIEFSGTPAMIRSIAEMKLPKLQRLVIGIQDDVGVDSDVYSTIKRIMANVQATRVRGLSINKDDVFITPEHVTGMDITSLAISSPTSITTMIALLKAVPGLQHLSIDNISLDGLPSDNLVPDPCDHLPVEPFDTRITRLLYTFKSSQFPPDRMVAAIKYLLLRIPTLEKFYGGEAPRFEIRDFALEYAPWYPHLATIRLVFY